MRRHTTSTVGLVARLALLTCTLIGLAAMHSLGHAGGTHTSTMLDGHHPELGTVSAAATLPFEDCSGRGCAHLTSLPGTGTSPAWNVCLAILSAVGAGALIAVLLSRRAQRRDPAGIGGGNRAGGSRAPPPVRPRLLGLTLAEASVLRI